MMNKTSRTIILFLPLGIMIIFNIMFILSHLGGKRGYLHTAYHAILNDFYGFHSVAFGVIVVILCCLGWRRNIPGAALLGRVFLAFLLFIIAMNVSFFSEFNRDTKGQESKRFRRLKTPYLEDAVRTSPAKSAEAIERYLQLGNGLKGKTLVIPWQSGDERFVSMIGFVDPRAVVRKKYPYLVGTDDLEFINTLSVRTSRFFLNDNMTESVVIISERPDAEVFTLFQQDRIIYFFSPEIVKRLPINIHD